MKDSDKHRKYELIGKCLYFPSLKTLVIGDLHLGYETMLKKQISIPFNQTKKTLDELKAVLDYLAENKKDVKKIILLGDIKHYFSFNQEEENSVNRIIEFLREKAEVICIRGNHDKMKIAGINFQDFYVKNNIAFIHGHKAFNEIYDKNINIIVMGHIHPTIILKDKQKIKAEKYKCFLVGRWKGKEVIILPSFSFITEGVSFNNFIAEHEDDVSIVPNKKIEEFEVFVPNGFEVLSFGKMRDLN